MQAFIGLFGGTWSLNNRVLTLQKCTSAGDTTHVAFVANLNLRRNDLDEKLGMLFFATVQVNRIFTCLFFKIKI